MRRQPPIACFLVLVAFASIAQAEPFKVSLVPSIGSPEQLQPHEIAFAELSDNGVANSFGLIPFEEWSEATPVQKQFLCPYPNYTEPTVKTTVEGLTQLAKEKLQMYVAEARFAISRPPQSINLARYTTIGFLEHLDSAIEHRPISLTDVDNDSNKHPDRQWCEAKTNVACFQSKYRLEGKLPMAIKLVNQLTDGKKISDYLEFQSELRILAPSELDQLGLMTLTGIDAPITGAIEQTIFHVNQVMQFGKFLAVFQTNQTDSNQTVVTTFLALAVKARLLEISKKYENVPVLRNLVPGMVLAGKSSFNTGSSISAGLPLFARNNISAIAAILDATAPSYPDCLRLQECLPPISIRRPDAVTQNALPAILTLDSQLAEPHLRHGCRQATPSVSMGPCGCSNSILQKYEKDCAADAGVDRWRRLP